MAIAMRVLLRRPIPMLGGHLAEIILRPPSRNVFDVMVSERLPGGFTDAGICRFASRLSGIGPSYLEKLDPADFADVRKAVDALFEGAFRRVKTGRLSDGGAP